MGISKTKLTTGLLAGACVAACAAPGLFGAVAFGGLASAGVAFACNDALVPLGTALIGGGLVFLWMQRRKSAVGEAACVNQCNPADSASAGCRCSGE